MIKMDFEYDYELHREKAFCIYEGTSYENSQHFECMLDILENKGYDRDEWFEVSDKEIKLEIGKNLIIGELALINNIAYILVYNIEDVEEVKKLYHHKILLHEQGNLYSLSK